MDLRYEIRTRGAIFEGKATEIISRELMKAMSEAVRLLETAVRENIPADVDGISRGLGVFGTQGGLKDSIAGEVDKGRSLIKGMTGTQMITGIIGHGKPQYGDIVEKGRRPGPVKPGVLIRWMMKKLNMSESEAHKKEFVLRRSIGKKGYPGIHMFERAFRDHEATVFAIFQRYGFQIAKAI